MKKNQSISLRKIFFSGLLFFCVCIGFSQTKSIFDIARNGTMEELNRAIEKNPNIINKANKEGYTPLTLACYSGNNEIAKHLIENVKNINSTSSYGTPLMAAVVKNNKELTELLILKKADINATDINGTSALHYAVMFNLKDIIKILVKAKASATLKDKRGNTALDYAEIKGNTTIIKLLKNK